MKKQKIKNHLREYLDAISIIDTHEHLVCESDRIAKNVDVLTLLHLYEYVDMTSAGYQPRENENVFVNNLMLDDSLSFEQKWQKILPHLEQIKFGCYYRPFSIALKNIYGIDDLNESTVNLANEKIKDANKPGLYKSILRDRCGIEKTLVQNGKIKPQDPEDIFIPLLSNVETYQFTTKNFLKHLEKTYSVKVNDFDQYLELLGKVMNQASLDGAIGFKIAAGKHVCPDKQAAQDAFKKWLKTDSVDPVLQADTLDFIFKKAEQLNWPVAVHCGIWWDYRTVDSKDMIDLIQRYPDVRFDLYHLGMPFVRDTIFIAKNFPNAYLNLCWCYVISQEITERAIGEILDTVPVNKVFGFGADYVWAVENVYGHLMMAKESLAEAFSQRIFKGRLDIDGTKKILKKWLYDNPKQFYNI
jgi:predicted TIM-barrel fold metal-dependent hydrolase